MRRPARKKRLVVSDEDPNWSRHPARRSPLLAVAVTRPRLCRLRALELISQGAAELRGASFMVWSPMPADPLPESSAVVCDLEMEGRWFSHGNADVAVPVPERAALRS